MEIIKTKVMRFGYPEFFESDSFPAQSTVRAGTKWAELSPGDAFYLATLDGHSAGLAEAEMVISCSFDNLRNIEFLEEVGVFKNHDERVRNGDPDLLKEILVDCYGEEDILLEEDNLIITIVSFKIYKDSITELAEIKPF